MLSLSLERFDYARVGEHVAVMQVLARVAVGQSAPAASELAIYAGPGVPLRFQARACRTERRLLAGGSTQTLWRALFTVPVSAVECTGALFELGAGAGFIETVILEMKPLAQSHHVRISFEGLAGDFRRAVLAQKSHVEMPVIRRPLSLPVPCRRFPCRGKIIEAVPMDP